jgi:hypothetical protein
MCDETSAKNEELWKLQVRKARKWEKWERKDEDGKGKGKDENVRSFKFRLIQQVCKLRGRAGEEVGKTSARS